MFESLISELNCSRLALEIFVCKFVDPVSFAKIRLADNLAQEVSRLTDCFKQIPENAGRALAWEIMLSDSD